MTQSRYIPSYVHQLAQPHRPNSLVPSHAKSRAGNAQPTMLAVVISQSRSRTSASNVIEIRKDASVRNLDPAEDALSP